MKNVICIVSALIIGFGAGYFFRGSSAPQTLEKEALPKHRAAIKNVAPDLRSAQPSRPMEVRETVVTNVITVTNAPFGGPGSRWRSPREWMENLKKQDPARFAQMTNRMAQWRQRRLERAQSKIDFLSSVNTSGWSSKAKKTHDELQDLIERREQIEESMHDDNLSDNDRHQLMDEMRRTSEQIRKLNQSERTTLLNETAKGLGISGQDVGDFTETIKEIVEATEGGFGGGPGGGNRPPPPPQQ